MNSFAKIFIQRPKRNFWVKFFPSVRLKRNTQNCAQGYKMLIFNYVGKVHLITPAGYEATGGAHSLLLAIDVAVRSTVVSTTVGTACWFVAVFNLLAENRSMQFALVHCMPFVIVYRDFACFLPVCFGQVSIAGFRGLKTIAGEIIATFASIHRTNIDAGFGLCCVFPNFYICDGRVFHFALLWLLALSLFTLLLYSVIAICQEAISTSFRPTQRQPDAGVRAGYA